MPRLRPPRQAGAIKAHSPALVVALTLLEKIEASPLSGDAKAVANMLALNNLVLGRALLSGRRLRRPKDAFGHQTLAPRFDSDS